MGVSCNVSSAGMGPVPIDLLRWGFEGTSVDNVWAPDTTVSLEALYEQKRYEGILVEVHGTLLTSFYLNS